MKLLFRQRVFSWLDSYDIYDETGNAVYTVEGKLGWGHCLHVLDRFGGHIATLKERVPTLLPKFDIYEGDRLVGTVYKEFTFFQPRFRLDFNGWEVEGDFLGWEYAITCGGRKVAQVSKELFHWSDTYGIDVADPGDVLCALLVVLAIDAEKCGN